jgi:hypothetical protein
MTTSPSRERIYLALAIVGAALPLLAFVPWLVQYGLDVEGFVTELFANRISAFFGWDVIVSAITILAVLALSPGELKNSQRASVALGTLLVGVSLGLPLFFYFNERERARGSEDVQVDGKR